ncbi:MAG: hypothetical protein K2H84_09275, partial [Paramuribaculum sp.]|nr:hypothetical protein [Paramuribaculum sp.]
YARGIASVIDTLRARTSVEVPAKFTVSMPQLSEDIVYSITITSLPTHDPTLFPCSYLIDWKLDSDNPRTGFSAYFNGNHYRFSGERIQEYHASNDSVPFCPAKYGAINATGVQQSAQFANLLPVSIADNLEKMLNDPNCTVTFIPDTLVRGKHLAAITAISSVNGSTGSESEYLLDPGTLFPNHIHIENSPGSISEQTIDIEFSTPRSSPAITELTEEKLISLYPEPFTLMRRSSFSLQNLKNRPLPGFSIPTINGKRFSRLTGDPFASTTLLAIIDHQASFAEKFVAELRSAAQSSPVPVNLVMAFTSNNADVIEEIAGTPLPGEAILHSARTLARDLGAAELPALLIVNTAGIVKDITVGYNNDLSSSVIQNIALINNKNN